MAAHVVREGAIPGELKALAQWVCWRKEPRDGKQTKVPYSPHGGPGESNDPATWGTFEEALGCARRRGMSGVGFVFSEDDPYCGVDLDGCRDPETGDLLPWAAEIVGELDSYAELSPSGTGVHIIVRGQLPPGRRGWGDGHGLYDRGRFFTVTGGALDGAPAKIGDRQAELEALHRRLFPPKTTAGASGVDGSRNGHARAGSPGLSDDALLDRARRAKNGAKFCALFYGGDASGYDSRSEADQSLCSLLAFWTQDEEQIDRLFRRSALNREKWERHPDYRARTIGKALEGRNEFYRGNGTLSAPGPGKAQTNGHGGSEPDPAAPGGGGHLTDVGNAERFIAEHGADVRWCEPWRCWFVWDGTRWVRDQSREVWRRAKETVRRIYAEASREGDDAARKALAKHAMKSETAARIRDLLELSKDGLTVAPEEFDRDPMALNAKNGTVDLRTGRMREHRREDLITKLAPVEYDPSARAPIFGGFLERILPSAEVRAFVGRLVGYAAAGETSEQVLPILYGTGANGKSTLLNVVMEALGDYAMQAAPDLLIAKQGAHPTERADLFGSRFVASVEVEDGQRLHESLVKQLTGGDRIRARRMREDFWEFSPTHTCFMAVNHKPVIRGQDNGIWRRVKLVHFGVAIPPAEQDRKLPEKLRGELAGILAWIVGGCLGWQREGLNPPPEVEAATSEYRAEMDLLGHFIAECCVVTEGARATAAELYKAYREWCAEGGQYTESQSRFGARLAERGFERRRSGANGATCYRGIGLPHVGAEDPDGTPQYAPAEPAALTGAPDPAGPVPKAPSPPGTGPDRAPAEEVHAPEGEGGEDLRARVSEVLRRSSELRDQLARCRAGEDRLVKPLASSLAYEIFGSAHRYREVLPAVEELVREGSS